MYLLNFRHINIILRVSLEDDRYAYKKSKMIDIDKSITTKNLSGQKEKTKNTY